MVLHEPAQLIFHFCVQLAMIILKSARFQVNSQNLPSKVVRKHFFEVAQLSTDAGEVKWVFYLRPVFCYFWQMSSSLAFSHRLEGQESQFRQIQVT